MFKKIDYVVLLAPDLEENIAFYRDKLNLKITREEKGCVEFATDNITVSLLGAEIGAELIGEKEANRQFYLSAAVDDVDSAYEQLKARGVEFIKPPATQEWGQRTAHFKDPAGTIWEIYTWVQEE
jgi:catechol 2,3-dioxygenase-like lactoylglutathione lyase family enzyme